MNKPLVASAKEVQKLQRNKIPFNLMNINQKQLLRDALDIKKENVEYFDGKEWVAFKTTSKAFTGLVSYRLAKGIQFVTEVKPQLKFKAFPTVREMEEALSAAKATVFKGTMVVSTIGIMKHVERHTATFSAGRGLGVMSLTPYSPSILSLFGRGSSHYNITFEDIEILPGKVLQMTIVDLPSINK